MNVLYILGNGFDKAQGMHTSYPEFYQYLMKIECSPLLEQMKKDIKEDTKLWSDMEEALGVFTSKVKSEEEMDSLHDELSHHLQDYLKIEEDNYIVGDKNRNKFLTDIQTPEQYLAETDQSTYNELRKTISDDTGGIYYNVISLNYTNTFENLLGGIHIFNSKKPSMLHDVCHVHGRLGDTIIIGVDNKDQIKNVIFRSSDDIASFLIKIEANAAMKNLRHSKCEQLIKTANLIVLFGVSFGDTDMRWWRLLGNELNKRQDIGVICFLYCPGEIPETRKYRLATVERRERQRLYSKMGITSNDMDNRFFIAINSLMFKKY